MNDLVILKLDKANTALREAKTIQETKKVADIAQAAEIYAKRQKLGDEAINYAYSIKLEALAKLGRMLEATKRNVGAVPGKTGSKGKPVLDDTPTLASLGLSKKESYIAQKLASLPPKQFESVKTGTNSIAKVIRELEGNGNGKKKEERKEGPPSLGMQYARMAIMQLEGITKDDTERRQAFDYVKEWIKTHEI